MVRAPPKRVKTGAWAQLLQRIDWQAALDQPLSHVRGPQIPIAADCEPANGRERFPVEQRLLLDLCSCLFHQFPGSLYVRLSSSGVSDGHPHGVLAIENGA
jgi:hypothetical protein